jgi:hypothetical protein
MKQEAPPPRRSRTGIPGIHAGEHVKLNAKRPCAHQAGRTARCAPGAPSGSPLEDAPAALREHCYGDATKTILVAP